MSLAENVKRNKEKEQRIKKEREEADKKIIKGIKRGK